MSSTVKTISPQSLSSINHSPSRDTTRRFRQSYVTFRRSTPSISAVCSTAVDQRTANHTVTPLSLYEVLGVQDDATCKEIKAAYRRLARAVHPDVVDSSSNGSDRVTSSVEFIRVNEAYVTLSDPAKREVYDHTLSFKRRTTGESPYYGYSNVTTTKNGTTSYQRFGGNIRRSWETDQCW